MQVVNSTIQLLRTNRILLAATPVHKESLKLTERMHFQQEHHNLFGKITQGKDPSDSGKETVLVCATYLIKQFLALLLEREEKQKARFYCSVF